jgi:hypothetical protein
MKARHIIRRSATVALVALAFAAGVAALPTAALASGERGQAYAPDVFCDTFTHRLGVTAHLTIAPGYDRQRIAYRVWVYNRTTRTGFYILNTATPGKEWFYVDHNRVQYLYDPSWGSYTLSYQDQISDGIELPLASAEYSVQVQYAWLSGYWVYSSFLFPNSYRQDQLYYSSTCRL